MSNELYKGIMKDHSHGVFNGRIIVRKDAQKTNAFQSNKNILLSDDAAITAKPQLEIFADDVKCSHGATTGQLDKEALFYLISRGIPKEKAQAMLVHAFASDVINKVKIDKLKINLLHLISERLNHHFN
jgi:Fe-S cluster assembly protein SufD